MALSTGRRLPVLRRRVTLPPPRLDPQQAQALAGHRIDHGEELRARAVEAEQDQAAAVDHDLLDAGAGRQPQDLRRLLHDRIAIARPHHEQRDEHDGAGHQRDPARDHKGLEEARDVVHPSRRSCAAS